MCNVRIIKFISIYNLLNQSLNSFVNNTHNKDKNNRLFYFRNKRNPFLKIYNLFWDLNEILNEQWSDRIICLIQYLFNRFSLYIFNFLFNLPELYFSIKKLIILKEIFIPILFNNSYMFLFIEIQIKKSYY